MLDVRVAAGALADIRDEVPEGRARRFALE